MFGVIGWILFGLVVGVIAKLLMALTPDAAKRRRTAFSGALGDARALTARA